MLDGKECKTKGERNQKRVKGRCGNLGDKGLVEFFGGRRKGLGRFDTQNKHKHRRSNGTKGKRQKAPVPVRKRVGRGWLDRIGLIFWGGEHPIHFDLEIFTTMYY